MNNSTFINLSLDKPISWKFFIKHLTYSSIWILGVFLILFRGDYFLLKMLPIDYLWIINLIPIVFIILVLILMWKSKWYYNLSLIFYPALVIFWFFPKTILNKGKIYLLSGYANFIFNRFKKLKSTIIHVSATASLILLLFATDSDLVRIASIFYFSFLYYKIVIKYVRQSLQPVKLFGANIENSLDELIENPEKSYSILKSFEETKSDEKLNDDLKKIKRVERLILANAVIEYLGTSLNSFRGKRAFVISWIYQLIGFVIIAISYFTFMNLELYAIDPSSYKVLNDPTIFDFFYYTFKTLIFSNIESILPISIFAKIIEISSFLTIGVFVLIIVISVIFSLRQDHMNENIQKATEVCNTQTRFITLHVKEKYQMDIQNVLIEAGSIKNSLEIIKSIMRKIL